MAISFIAATSADAATGNVSITHGLSITSGDVIVATINANGAGNTVTDNNGSTAFTADHNTANPDSGSYYVFSRVCGGSEPATYSWTLGSSNRWSVVLRQYRGVDATIWDVAPGASTVTTGLVSATAVASSITIATSGACGLVLMGDDAFPTTTTFTSIDNSYANTQSETGQQYQTTSDKLGLSTGSTGATTVTSSANVSYVIYQVALKPAASVTSKLLALLGVGG